MLAHDTTRPDLETASAGYAGRFAGAAGRFLLDTQERLVVARLPAGRPLSVLEVGGGHGQLSRALLGQGCAVTVQGSAPQAFGRLGPLRGELCCVASSLWHLPFADRSFDVVIGVRLLAHVTAWRALLDEMARLCRRRLIVDFAPTGPAGDLAFRLKRRVEGNTRPFFRYRQAELVEHLARRGLEVEAIDRQFLLPMVVHRMIGRRGLSAALEAAAAGAGLTRRWGGPALLTARRR